MKRRAGTAIEPMTAKTANRLRSGLLSLTLMMLASITLGGTALSSDKRRTHHRASAAARTRPIDLRNIEQLRSIFQRDDGKVRVVVLVSPT